MVPLNMRIRIIIILAVLLLLSCQTLSSVENFAETKKETMDIEAICDAPAKYVGNYVTGFPPKLSSRGTTEYSIKPAEYKWVAGEVSGASIEYKLIRAKYKTTSKRVPSGPCPYAQDPGLNFKPCDETYTHAMKWVTLRQVIVPPRVEKCEIPYLKENGKTRILDKPSRVILVEY